MKEGQILSEEIIAHYGSLQRVRQYIAGWNPELGLLHQGWSGKETVREIDRIIPVKKMTIYERTNHY